jgi:hypothetical protein
MPKQHAQPEPHPSFHPTALPCLGAVADMAAAALTPRTALSLLLLAAFCYSAWLTSIVFCASSGSRPLLIASAIFFPAGIGVWFDSW